MESTLTSNLGVGVCTGTRPRSHIVSARGGRTPSQSGCLAHVEPRAPSNRRRRAGGLPASARPPNRAEALLGRAPRWPQEYKGDAQRSWGRTRAGGSTAADTLGFPMDGAHCAPANYVLGAPRVAVHGRGAGVQTTVTRVADAAARPHGCTTPDAPGPAARRGRGRGRDWSFSGGAWSTPAGQWWRQCARCPPVRSTPDSCLESPPGRARAAAGLLPRWLRTP